MSADLAAIGPKVAGYCPMGCGQTLHLDHRGEVRCFEYHCANKRAVATILNDPQVDHVVTFTEAAFTVKHPLRERLGDELVTCELTTKVGLYRSAYGAPPAGRFRAIQHEEFWHLEAIE